MRNKIFIYSLAVVIILIISMVSFIKIELSIVIILGSFFLFFLIKNPLYSLILIIFIIPFSGTYYLSKEIAGIPGFKILTVLSLTTIFVFFVSRKITNVNKKEIIFIFLYLILFTYTVLRATSYLDVINYYFYESMNFLRFFLSFYIKPVLYFIPFIIIICYITKENEIKLIFKMIEYSILLLSLYVLFNYMFYIPDKFNFEFVRKSYLTILGLHGNGLANFYIIIYPLIFASFIYNKNLLTLSNFALSILVIGILYSRTAYLLLIISTLLLILISKKTKWIPVIVGFGIIIAIIIPSSIIERSMTGFGGSTGDANEVSAGRTEHIWIPVLNEVKNEPYKLLFGNGRHAILSTMAYRSQIILPVGHAHNMYIDMLLDAGIIGLLFFLFSAFSFIKYLLRKMNTISDDYFKILVQACLISVICFLIGGLTGRQLFPELSNSLLWLVIALALTIIKIENINRTKNNE